jgi:hypothetical protein
MVKFVHSFGRIWNNNDIVNLAWARIIADSRATSPRNSYQATDFRESD